MHCPRCGQQQISEETKFCSKCGFQLHVISAVLMHGGSLPQLDFLNQQQGKRPWLNRRNGMIFSLFWFIFFLMIVTPFWGIMDVDALAGISAIFGIFGGLIIFLASAFFLEGKPKTPNYYPYPPSTPMAHQMPQYSGQMHQQPQQPQYGYQQGALPPQQSVPVSTYTPPPHVAGSWRDTNDLGRPSVTEDTTRLLTKEEEQ